MNDDRLVIRVLDTTADDVPPSVPAELAAACEPVPEISAAYVARMSYRFESDDVGYESLNFAFELATSPSRDAAPEEDLRVRDQLFERLPWSIARTGVHFPSPAGMHAWRKRGVRVFNRAASDGPQR